MKGITTEYLKKNGWVLCGTIDDGFGEMNFYTKNINGVFYSLYYSGMDEDYTLVKHLDVVDNIEDLEKLLV